MAIDELGEITYGLRNIVLSRWTDSKILDYVVVKIPAPVFDRLVVDIKAEMPTATLGYDLAGAGSSFTFAGIKFERVDGQYWSVTDAALTRV